MNLHLQRMFSELDTELSPSDKRWIAKTTDENFDRLHFTLGLVIRNKFIHAADDGPGKNLDSIFNNPDGVSSLLSKLYWWHLFKIEPTKEMIESALDQHLITWSDGKKAQGMEILSGQEVSCANRI